MSSELTLIPGTSSEPPSEDAMEFAERPPSYIGQWRYIKKPWPYQNPREEYLKSDQMHNRQSLALRWEGLGFDDMIEEIFNSPLSGIDRMTHRAAMLDELGIDYNDPEMQYRMTSYQITRLNMEFQKIEYELDAVERGEKRVVRTRRNQVDLNEWEWLDRNEAYTPKEVDMLRARLGDIIKDIRLLQDRATVIVDGIRAKTKDQSHIDFNVFVGNPELADKLADFGEMIALSKNGNGSGTDNRIIDGQQIGVAQLLPTGDHSTQPDAVGE